MIDLSHKNILVTGATGGIGREIVSSCLLLGAKVYAIGRDMDKLNDLAGNSRLTQLSCDLTNAEEVNEILNKVDGLTGVVHCAGKVYPYPIKYIKEKHLREVYSLNTDAVITLTAKLFQLKKIEKKSSLVFLSSISVQHPYMGGSIYVSSKAAIEAFSKAVALEFATDGIRSNCIAPALIKTEIYEQTKSAYTNEQWDGILAQYPLGIGLPKDVANLAVFLLSDLSSWITGTTIPMDGGLLLNSNR
jgi:NAD(P)-dependent dehydrogenase (short-subunit alcohol dehydrogenase family)